MCLYGEDLCLYGERAYKIKGAYSTRETYAMKDAYTVDRAYKTRVSITLGGGYTVFCTLHGERYAGLGIHGFS